MRWIIQFVVVLPAISPILAADYHVSPNGDDGSKGTLEKPLRTIAAAAKKAGPGDMVHVRGGIYCETLRPAKSGIAGRPITFRNYRDEKAVITGADMVTNWKREEGGVWSAPVTWGLKDRNQVFGDGEIMTEARWPNNKGTLLKVDRAHAQKGAADSITDPKLPDLDLVGAHIWCAGGSRWICWSARVTGHDRKTKTIKFKRAKGGYFSRFYRPRKGTPYVLMGLRCLLDAEGEWWLDNKAEMLYIIPPKGRDPNGMKIEFKRRENAIDLTDLSHIRLVGLRVRGAGIAVKGRASDILLDGMKGEYVGHSYEKDISNVQGIQVHGERNALRNCEFSWSSGAVVMIRGDGNSMVNCYIHDGNYGAKWQGTVVLAGRRHVVAYNTIQNSGRDLVNIHKLTEGLIEYNDLSRAGWLTDDLGMIYGHNNDFGNTVIRRNHVHDNLTRACAMGIYFDHLSHNAIVHNNVVWNVKNDPIRFNNPSYFSLVYNNTAVRSGGLTTFDHARRNDLFLCRYLTTTVTDRIKMPKNAVVENNLIEKSPALVNPDARDFSPKVGCKARDKGRVLIGITDQKPSIGACEFGEKPWKVGHDFDNPPKYKAEIKPVRIAWMNTVYNACFELPTIEGWNKTGAGRARLEKGNGWGHNSDNGKPEPTGTSARVLRLGGGRDGVEQRIEGLNPGRQHTLSAWLKVSPGESVRVGVRGHGGEEVSAATSSRKWERKTIEFQAGAKNAEAVIFVEKTSRGKGYAWCDNIGLPLTP